MILTNTMNEAEKQEEREEDKAPEESPEEESEVEVGLLDDEDDEADIDTFPSDLKVL